MPDSDWEARAEARRSRAILRKTSLDGAGDDPIPLWGEEAISLVHELTRSSWSLAGKDWPSYTRAEIPCRFIPGPLR